jgi:acetoin utilization deacetylase AcuC-like enzyme
LAGEAQNAFVACRPPGHHAEIERAMGFCLFNNISIGARHAQRKHGLMRVAIVDFDVHHGNGTQQIFWRRGDVLYVSLHAHPDRQYPYFLGRADETGEGQGSGANLNLPLPAGTDDDAFLAALDRGLAAIADTPGDVIVVSLGFDTYGQDPIGDFALTTAVYHECGKRTAALGRKLVILQEGGYHRPALGANARAWLRGAEGRPFDPMPAAGFGPGGSDR